MSAPPSPTDAEPVSPPSAGDSGVRLRESKLAQRQLSMKREESAYMRRCAMQTWAKAALPSALRGRILGGDGGSRTRTRRLSCP